MPGEPQGVPRKEYLDRFAKYFQENYSPGRPLETPDSPYVINKGIMGPKGKSWVEWKNKRLRDLRFYDQDNFRIVEDIDQSPPRIMLREDDLQVNGALTVGHFEFKTYMQDKHEQDSRGYGTSRFLSSEQRVTEEGQAIDTEEMLIDNFSSILEKHLIENDDVEEGRQLALIRELIGRVDHDLNWWKTPGGKAFLGNEINFGVSGILERKNILDKIGKQVVRTLISCSKNSLASDREVYQWMSFEASPSGEGNRLLDYAKIIGITKGLELLATDKEVDASIQRQFVSSGRFDPELFERHLRLKGEVEDDFRENRRVSLTIRNLIENQVNPPDDRMRMDIYAAGIQWIPLLGSKIEEIISSERKRMLEIVDKHGKKAKLDDSRLGLDEIQKRDLSRIRDIGFGGTKGISRENRTVEKVIKHNSVKLAYNIKSLLIKEGLLRTRKMTKGEYRSYFLDDDESLEKVRQGKKWPGVVVFSSKLKSMIGNSEYEDFANGSENSIYRWLKMPRNRWMYCPPKPHRKTDGSLSAGGLLHPSLSKLVSNVTDYDDFEVEDRRNPQAKEKVKTSRCEPNEEIIEALNLLQETQWEINLDLLEVMCEFEIDIPGVEELINYQGKLTEKEGLIHRIKPKKEFAPSFYDNDSEIENDRRKLVLNWIRMIIEHNANVFWHSWVCDFRGRMFPRCSELSPHDGDFGKSLIRFKEWKPLGERGFFWLRVHLHNLMEGIGVDGKLPPAEKGRTFDQRVEWVDRNSRVLQEIANNPTSFLVDLRLEKRRFGRREDFQRLSVLIEYNRVINEYNAQSEVDKERDWSKVRSGLPVHLDASCNGYQHVSSLLRIEDLAELVNVKVTDDGPHDLYQEVADVAREIGEGELRNFLSETSLEERLFDPFIERVFTRSVAKKPTMVRVYGGGDVAKSLEGKRGRGRSDFSKPMPRNYSKSQEDRISKISPDFRKAYQEFIESDGDLQRAHFMQYSVNQKTGKSARKKGEIWEKLLQPEIGMRLWAPGSSMHDAVIEPGGDLANFFVYDSEDDGGGWIHQQILTDILKDVYQEAIQRVTGMAYDLLERSLDHSVANSDCLWPGITWEVLPPSKDESGGYVVHQYYIKRHGANSTRGGIPCHRASVYTGIVPKWYSQTDYLGNKNAKSTSRIMVRAKHLYADLPGLGDELRLWLDSSKRWDEGKMRSLLNKIEGATDPKKANEIRELMEHKDYSVQIYHEDEKKRVNKKKVRSSISPNFVHSLDAYHMRSTIREFAIEQDGGGSAFSFWAVHDAFGTHASEIDRMREVVLEEFKSLHTNKSIIYWLERLQWIGKDKAPSLDPEPAIGKLWESGTEEISDYLIS